MDSRHGTGTAWTLPGKWTSTWFQKKWYGNQLPEISPVCVCVDVCPCVCASPFVESGRVSLRVTHTRVWAMHNAMPGPSSAPLAPYPPYLTSSLPPTPPPLPLPLPPSLASSPPHPLGPPCCRLLPRVPPPCLPAVAAVMSAVRLAACFGPRCRVTAGLAPGCVGVIRREAPQVSKPPPVSVPVPAPA